MGERDQIQRHIRYRRPDRGVFEAAEPPLVLVRELVVILAGVLVLYAAGMHAITASIDQCLTAALR